MTTSAAATHVIPAGLITHTTVSVKGQLDPDITVHHARTPGARVTITIAGIHMSLYNCQTAQGLLEAFVAARGHMIHVPAKIPAGAPPADEPAARAVIAIEWTRAPAYAVVAQSALNRLKTAKVHWVDLYTGPITWQLRDRSAILSMIDSLKRVHDVAIAVFADGEQYKADPTTADDHAA
ncbi:MULTISPECIES: hypothetical protein [Mycobacterium avium complex (MAC)]|uniref:Uncharacterized protein n=1 Tax=Mycobacterium avium subsp. hominissuis TaxID=439334 RepID=A0A187NFJ3_MYCAV|nr:hypothetical protein [Mycobacterium avium]AKT73027.1 hypothetical protein MASH_00024 [Mycobacterium avium subsp. hominissuis]MBZ4522184.1 hypothetical protein [Mycobacterium avium subsp. hominissuis]MBZ4526711.1 hypothetical protein [Mycobacterium avium subsp. hominissuis]MBZ4533091.1 hypothetical protein [Mycobacterium avium subsp. hominissuis]MBZ4546016.1 hypothetical protein [Mycobacterium avium subsp. hominissuis]